ncbi:MAG: MFS transporter [Candidatus Marinimicrobia bacterium]|nr:MFS transporter [Candidatus Neomarinimicrobiota bacterium]
MKNQNNNSALYTLVSVFFFWGFIAASNGVFIPFCKTYFSIDQFQSQLVDFAFYGAYYIGALILFIWSSQSGKDVLNSWGYKRGIIYGLIISAIGALIMIPSVNGAVFGETQVFYYVLIVLFIVGLGFSLQQTAANPFAVSLGNPATGSNRLNLAGGVNSFGTTIGPLLIAFILFGSAPISGDELNELIKTGGIQLNTIQGLYLGVAALFITVAIFFYVSKNLPDAKNEDGFEPATKAKNLLILLTVIMILCFGWIFYTYMDGYDSMEGEKLENYRLLASIISLVAVFGLIYYAYKKAQNNAAGWGALQYPQLGLGMLAIFTYVGVEVTIQSNLGELLKNVSDAINNLNPLGLEVMSDSEIAKYISLYWGGLMIGRWSGSITVFNPSEKMKKILLCTVPFLAFGVIIGVNQISGNPITSNEISIFSFIIIIQIIGFYLAKDNAITTMKIFSLLGVLAMLIGVLASGKIALFAFLTGGLFCSIMWPCIFSLSINGIGKYTSQGSSFLIMMILGGAIIPPVQGKLADIFSIQESYWVAVLCFAFLLIYSFITQKVLAKQNLL